MSDGAAVRAGFAGGGFMAAVHSRAARSAGARTVALAASSAESAERSTHRLGIERAAASVTELVEGEADVVHVCTPNATHAGIALAAITAGKHVRV